MKKVYLNTLTPEEVIKRLKDGEVIHIDGIDSNSFKMIDGIICRCLHNKAHILDAGLDIENDDYYFEEEEKFEITETGLYKTRDGRQVYVSFVDYAYDYPVRGCISGSLDMYSWTREGIILKVKKSDADIVAKWEE